MALSLCSIASGSKGNCTIVREGDEVLVIDAGVSAARVLKGLDAVGFGGCTVAGIVVTHEHSDHVAGVRVLAKKTGAALHTTPGTFEGGKRHLHEVRDFRPMEARGTYRVGRFLVEPFSTFHDAKDPVAVVVRSAERPDDAVAVVTDLGFVSTLCFEKLRGCRTILFEANHDRKMLIDGPYPPELKQRILSRHGHLDNETTARALERLYASGTREVLLAHLSETNNSPEVVLQTMEKYLTRRVHRELQLSLTYQDRPSAVLGGVGSLFSLAPAGK